MSRLTIRSIEEVADRHLCSGCGVCAYLQPDVIAMDDVRDYGRRPRISDGPKGGPPDTSLALRACPGVGLTRDSKSPEDRVIESLWEGWGPILELWEGHATDPELRYLASSGGAASALALHGIERGGAHGVLHIRARPDQPYSNETVLSTNREEVFAATGSRYAPASPCDRLDLIEASPSPCVFIGKPCDVAALSMARRLRPELDKKVGLTIAIFCAGTPSTRGTIEMLRAMGVDDPESIEGLRYRGRGWPGAATATVRPSDRTSPRQLSYEESWGGILQKHRQWRCHVCADHTGEFADISVGDPWYRPIPPDEHGQSLVLVRTERGREAVRSAMLDDMLTLTPSSQQILVDSQPNLLRARGATWGRGVATRSVGVAAPRYRNFSLFQTWWRHLTVKEKAQSLYGTLKRVFTKRLYTKEPHVLQEDAVRVTKDDT